MVMKKDREDSGDVESGTIDSGLAEDVVIQKKEGVARKPRIDESDDPKKDINSSGVGVNHIDD